MSISVFSKHFPPRSFGWWSLVRGAKKKKFSIEFLKSNGERRTAEWQMNAIEKDWKGPTGQKCWSNSKNRRKGIWESVYVKRDKEPFQLPGQVGQCPVSNRRLVRMLKTTRTRLHWRWMRVRFSSLKQPKMSSRLFPGGFFTFDTGKLCNVDDSSTTSSGCTETKPKTVSNKGEF